MDRPDHDTVSSPNPVPLRVVPLGGLGQFGMNMMVYEYDDELIVVDVGLMFPRETLPGVDVGVPDMSYVLERADRVRGVFLTHGHEDHIGALPHLLPQLDVPVYGSRLTLGLVREKLRDLGRRADLREVSDREVVEAGAMTVEMLAVTHSIPDALALAITTPAGVAIHTGDFKLDHSPIDGRRVDYQRFAHYGERGVLLLASDSTNAEVSAHTESERTVRAGLEAIVRESEGRVVVATFASNVHRLQILIDVATEQNRRVVLCGRSLLTTFEVGQRLGYLRAPAGLVVDSRRGRSLSPWEQLVISAGTQAEPGSSMARIAADTHRDIHLDPGDAVVLSARTIPGNEGAVSNMISDVLRRGARLYTERDLRIHVSGHAYREELKQMIDLVRPQHFLPLHGEYRQLHAHAELARQSGVAHEGVLIAESGDVVEVGTDGIRRVGRTPVGVIYVDSELEPVEDVVLSDRKHVQTDGFAVAVVVLHRDGQALHVYADVVSRAMISPTLWRELYPRTVALLEELAANSGFERHGNRSTVENRIHEELRKFFRRRTQRRPLVIPVVLEV